MRTLTDKTKLGHGSKNMDFGPSTFSSTDIRFASLHYIASLFLFMNHGSAKIVKVTNGGQH